MTSHCVHYTTTYTRATIACGAQNSYGGTVVNPTCGIPGNLVNELFGPACPVCLESAVFKEDLYLYELGEYSADGWFVFKLQRDNYKNHQTKNP